MKKKSTPVLRSCPYISPKFLCTDTMNRGFAMLVQKQLRCWPVSFRLILSHHSLPDPAQRNASSIHLHWHFHLKLLLRAKRTDESHPGTGSTTLNVADRECARDFIGVRSVEITIYGPGACSW